MESESVNKGQLSNTGRPFVVTRGTSELSRDMGDYPEGIIIPIDKPYRWTSADVIRKLKYAAIRHFGKRNLKIGHAGTLDPLATGILIVCMGKATKLAQALMDHDKEYVAGIRFGATTPSYDLEKEIDRKFPYEHITEEAVREKLAGFIGVQEQVAPLFSAKSIEGVRAYEHARRLYKRQGREADNEGCDEGRPRSGKGDARPLREGNAFDEVANELIRTVRINIYEAELLSFRSEEPHKEELRNEERNVSSDGRGGQPAEASVDAGGEVPIGASVDADSGSPVGASCGTADEASAREAAGASGRIHVASSAPRLPHADIRLACGKGTYVRAFARDLGEALGSGAHLDSLHRTKNGPFDIGSAVPLDQVLSLFK